jgi:putative transcriptional regulator
MSKNYRSGIAESVHLGMSRLNELGLVDMTTMRDLDESCVVPVKQFDAEAVKALRQKERASQAVLARHLNVATSTVSQWERGERHPEGAALKLLTLIHLHGLQYISS